MVQISLTFCQYPSGGHYDACADDDGVGYEGGDGVGSVELECVLDELGASEAAAGVF